MRILIQLFLQRILLTWEKTMQFRWQRRSDGGLICLKDYLDISLQRASLIQVVFKHLRQPVTDLGLVHTVRHETLNVRKVLTHKGLLIAISKP